MSASKSPLRAPNVRQLVVAQATRVVVKVGTRVLVNSKGMPDERRIAALVKGVAALRHAGKEVVLVTSGAIGSGMEALGLTVRPKTLPELQMAAAVGQCRLMSVYQRLFAAEKVCVGQVLLTYDDLRNRLRHLNARNTMLALLRNGVVPIVNENDVVSVDEIKVGDNDVLAALVTTLIQGELLILLSTTNGLKDISKRPAKRISFVENVTERELKLVGAKGSDLSTGGMGSKLRAAQLVVENGGHVIIADGRTPRGVASIFEGRDVGTLFGGMREERSDRGRKRWIAYFNRAQGSILVDEGARVAIEQRGRSLLPAGVRAVEGKFGKGSVANIRGLDGTLIARGLVEYSSEDLRVIRGRRSSEIQALLGMKDADEVIHRDNMVVLSRAAGVCLER